MLLSLSPAALIREVLNFNILSDLISRCPVDQPELLILIKSIEVYSVQFGSEMRTIRKVIVCLWEMGARGQNSLDSARDDTCRSKLDGAPKIITVSVLYLHVLESLVNIYNM